MGYLEKSNRVLRETIEELKVTLRRAKSVIKPLIEIAEFVHGEEKVIGIMDQDDLDADAELINLAKSTIEKIEKIGL